MVEGRFCYRDASRYYLAVIRLSLPFLWGLTVCSTLGLAQVDRQFADQLVRQTVVLRNFYTGKKLKYDAKGVLISGGTAGSGPADGRVYVEALKLEKDKVIIRGERPISVFNPGTGESSLLGLHDKVEIEADLPSDKGASEAATEMLHRIFLTAAETDQFTCPGREEKAFREWTQRTKEFVSVSEDGKQSRREPRQLCFPDGNRAYGGGNKVIPPKPLKTSNPAYPPSEQGTQACGPGGLGTTQKNTEVILALIIDGRGKPSSPVVIGASASVTEFDEAVIKVLRGWKFQPANYQGRPVPVAISVEVDFRLRKDCADMGRLGLGDSAALDATVQTTFTLK